MSGVVCPTCAEAGQKSMVIAGQSTTTLMRSHTLYDEEGNRFVLNPNKITTDYRCSRGHVFQRKDDQE